MKFYYLLCSLIVFSTFNWGTSVEARVTNLYFPKNSKSQTKIIDQNDKEAKLLLRDDSGHQEILYDCRYKYYDSSESGKMPVIYCELPLKKTNKVYKLNFHVTTNSKNINRNSKITSVSVARDTEYKTTATNYAAKISNIYNMKQGDKYKYNGRFNLLTVDRTDSRKTADTSVLYDSFKVIEVYKNTEFEY
ncbi:hypothetical protein BCR36DRAFT_415852, partial [Piromyces finnis]